jgi:hypothetical protein
VQSSLFLVDDSQDVDNQVVLFGMPMADFIHDSDMHKSLRERRMSLHDDVGKRYVVRTQHGFLNVHFEPTAAFDTDNTVNQLTESQIVTSTGPTRGIWVHTTVGAGVLPIIRAVLGWNYHLMNEATLPSLSYLRVTRSCALCRTKQCPL